MKLLLLLILLLHLLYWGGQGSSCMEIIIIMVLKHIWSSGYTFLSAIIFRLLFNVVGSIRSVFRSSRSCSERRTIASGQFVQMSACEEALLTLYMCVHESLCDFFCVDRCYLHKVFRFFVCCSDAIVLCCCCCKSGKCVVSRHHGVIFVSALLLLLSDG